MHFLLRLKSFLRRWAWPLLALAFAWWGLPWLVSLPDGLAQPLDAGQRFLARDGSPLRHLLNTSQQRVGAPVDLARLPEVMLQATLAAEDKRFYSHSGVDFLAVLRALKTTVTGSQRSGASTITMQLAKVATQPPRERNLWTKFMEMLQARQLEMRWSKERILSEYLNRVSYGNLFTGLDAACQGYLSKPLRDLTVAECAFLAALPQAPTRLNPFKDRKAVQPRQQYILQRMLELGYLDKEGYDLAVNQALILQRHHGGFTAPHAVALAQRESQAQGNIRTSIDPVLQRQVEDIVAFQLGKLKDRGADHAAVVVIENRTGRVLALVGSRDFSAEDGGQINGAWEPRSPGSAVKPFTYALALERGASPASIVYDLPMELQTSTGLYTPENYDKRSYGPMTYRHALGNSLNLSAVRVLKSLGGESHLHTALQKLGITTLDQPAEHYGLGLTIGNAPVRLLELTNAYACLARGGVLQKWTLLEDEVIAPTMERFCSELTAWLIADILQDNTARVISFGQNSVLRLPFRAAVKTGTSTNYRDNWCIGFVPEFTVGVWAGNFAGVPMQQVSGVSGAGPIWRDVMLKLKSTHQLSWFTEPQGLEHGRIDLSTGKRLNQGVRSPRFSREEVWAKLHPPALAQQTDYELKTRRSILPLECKEWIKSPDNWLGDSVTCDASSRFQDLRITSPVDGMVIIAGNKLKLSAEPNDDVKWMSDTLLIREEEGQTWAVHLRKGKHVVVALRGEARAKVSFEVK